MLETPSKSALLVAWSEFVFGSLSAASTAVFRRNSTASSKLTRFLIVHAEFADHLLKNSSPDVNRMPAFLAVPRFSNGILIFTHPSSLPVSVRMHFGKVHSPAGLEELL